MNIKIAEAFSTGGGFYHNRLDLIYADFDALTNSILGDIATATHSHTVVFQYHSEGFFIFDVEVKDERAFNVKKLSDARFLKQLNDWQDCYRRYLDIKDNGPPSRMDVFCDF